MDYSPEEVCAMLTIKACPKHLIPRLEFDDTFRTDVTNRLREVGYEFVDDPISQHFDARLSQDIRHLEPFTEGPFPPNEGQSVVGKALLVILWCNLILPKYDHSLKKQMDEDPHVTEEQLFENFKSQLGSMQNLRKNLTVLKQQGFILGVRGTTSMIAGPRLSTAVDNSKLYEQVRKHVIDLLINETDALKEETSLAFTEITKEGGDTYEENYG